MKIFPLVAVIVIGGILHAPLQAADADAGETSYNARGCVGCHGPAGKQPLPTFPAIGGMPVEFIVGELKRFKSGERASPIMGPMAAGLKQVDIDNLARYLSAQ